jgi:prepilin-type N-terminal cleavage/methylation domain-containing protein
VQDRSRGFTLMELMITVVIVGILAAASIANFVALQRRAREASLKTNMHVFQVATEDYGVRSGSVYPTDASQAAALMSQGGSVFYNPYTKQTGSDQAWADQPTWARPLASGSTIAGIVAYGDSVGTKYQIVGRGSNGDLPLILTSGL